MCSAALLPASSRRSSLKGAVWLRACRGTDARKPGTERVAEAAGSFGREDDLAVVSITRTPVREPLPAKGLHRFPPAV